MMYLYFRERVLRGKYRIPFYMSTDCEHLLKALNHSYRSKANKLDKDREKQGQKLSIRTLRKCFKMWYVLKKYFLNLFKQIMILCDLWGPTSLRL